MPDLTIEKLTNTHYQACIDGHPRANLFKSEAGKWHLGKRGADELEEISLLSDGTIFKGGTLTEATNAFYADWMHAGAFEFNFNMLDQLISKTDLKHSQEKFINAEGITVDVFSDGDITHEQNLITGKGSYTTTDKHGGYNRYWGAGNENHVILSFHQKEHDDLSDYLGMHFFESSAQAHKVFKGYFGHQFALLFDLRKRKQTGAFQVLNDEIGISQEMADKSWNQIALHVAQNNNLKIVIACSMTAISEDDYFCFDAPLASAA